jgi:1,4-dihydroxy-2-naphthoate octaprenyltransferase
MPDAELPTDWRKWILGARPRTLPAAVAPVLVGTAAAAGYCSEVAGTGMANMLERGARCAAVGTGSTDAPAQLLSLTDATDGALRGLHLWAFLCALGVAVFVQIATNFANDYSDGKRGTDAPGERVGPPRLVGNGLATPDEVKRAMLVSFGLTALCGLPLVLSVSPWLRLVGLAAIAAGWFYTGGPRPYGYAGFGEAFVFVFFGLVATVGSFFVQTASVSWLALGCGVAMGCLATALLVVNNLRDIPGDTRAGKQTLAVRLGDQRTRYLFVVLLVVPMLVVPFLAGASGRLLAALALLAVVPARRPVVGVLGGARGRGLIPVLADTGKVQMVYGVLLALGLFLGS